MRMGRAASRRALGPSRQAVGRARAILLATAAIVSCGKGGGSGGGSGGADGGLHGPTDVVVSWTIAGKPADASICMMQSFASVNLNLSGTLDPSLHQNTTVDCGSGPVTFKQIPVEGLGDNAYLEGLLLDPSMTTRASVGVTLVPALPTTNVTLAFFGPAGTGGMTTTSSTSHSASSTSGMGGTGGVTSSSASTGGATSSSAASSAASTSGMVDAGGD